MDIIDVVEGDVVVPAIINKPLLHTARNERVDFDLRRNEAYSGQCQCPQGEELRPHD